MKKLIYLLPILLLFSCGSKEIISDISESRSIGELAFQELHIAKSKFNEDEWLEILSGEAKFNSIVKDLRSIKKHDFGEGKLDNVYKKIQLAIGQYDVIYPIVIDNWAELPNGTKQTLKMWNEGLMKLKGDIDLFKASDGNVTAFHAANIGLKGLGFIGRAVETVGKIK